jgi:hypothetical protein
MPVIAGNVDVWGQLFTPDGENVGLPVYKTAPQEASPPRLVDLSLYSGKRVAIVCVTFDSALWGASEIGILTATVSAITVTGSRFGIAARGSTIRLEDGLLRPCCEVLFVDRNAVASTAEREIGETRRSPIHQVIYMNRHGGRYTGGDDDSARKISSVVRDRGYQYVDAAPFQGSDADWVAIIQGMRNRYSKFNVTITDIEPTSGNYIEAVISGNPGSLLGFKSNVVGYSPQSCSIIPNAVSFTFSQVYLGDNNAIAETAAHEVGHTLSLNHEVNQNELMNWQVGYTDQEFIDGNFYCGDDRPGTCFCGGTAQNSVQKLLQILGPAGPPPIPVPPFVSIISPDNGAQLPANSDIAIVAEVKEGVEVTTIELIWEFTGGTLACPGSGTDWSSSQSGRTYKWQLNVGTGSRVYRIHAVDANGNSMLTDTRTLQLIGGPPPSYQFPTITVNSPAPETTLRRGQPFRIEAGVHSSGSPVSHVYMEWSGDPAGGYSYPLTPFGNEIWGLNTSMSSNAATGERKLAIRAQTERGETSITPPLTLYIV